MRLPLKFVVAFGFYNPGDIVEPTGVYYDWLVDQGYCEPVVQAEPTDVECAALDVSDTEKAVVHKPVKRKRGRPRKIKVE